MRIENIVVLVLAISVIVLYGIDAMKRGINKLNVPDNEQTDVASKIVRFQRKWSRVSKLIVGGWAILVAIIGILMILNALTNH